MLFANSAAKLNHSHPIGIDEKAGTNRFALPHGRDKKRKQSRSSRFEIESAAADLQFDS
jgi:hypothetical protein